MALSEVIGLESIGLKKERDGIVTDLMVFVRNLSNPIDDLKEIDTFEHKNNGNIYEKKH